MLSTVDNLFPKYLLDELNKRGWSQAELARKAGLTRGAISHVLNGDRKAGPDMCEAIANAFHLPPEQVFRVAGLLPPERAPEEKYEELLSILDTFTEEQCKDVLKYARFVLGENEKSSVERKSRSRTGTTSA